MNSSVEFGEIKGFDGYRVGSDGSVWSAWKRSGMQGLTGAHWVLSDEWHRLKPGFVKGYPRVCLYKQDGRKHYRRVHHLVLEAFVGPCPQGLECRHLDGVRLNAAVGNLAWGTPVENARDKRRHGTLGRARVCGEANHNHKLTTGQVAEIRQLLDAGLSQRNIAARFGVSHFSIGAIDRGKTWRAA